MSINVFWILMIAFVVVSIIIFSLMLRISKLENFCGFILYLIFGDDEKSMIETVNEVMQEIESGRKED